MEASMEEHSEVVEEYSAPELTEFGTVEDFTHGIGISIFIP
jgi:hypothetical protein